MLTATRTSRDTATATQTRPQPSLDWARIAAELDAARLRNHGPPAVARCVQRDRAPSTQPRPRSAAASSWRGTASAAASTSISPIPCRELDRGAARGALSAACAEIANRWNEAMGIAVRYPGRARRVPARAATRPARPGRRRCCCSTAPATTTACTRTSTASTSSRCRWRSCCREPGSDFTGGEFVLTEQRPRMQSRAEVVPLAPGRRRDLPGAPPPGAGHARRLSRQHAPRRQPPALRPPPHARHHLPRRQVNQRGATGASRGRVKPCGGRRRAGAE